MKIKIPISKLAQLVNELEEAKLQLSKLEELAEVQRNNIVELMAQNNELREQLKLRNDSRYDPNQTTATEFVKDVFS